LSKAIYSIYPVTRIIHSLTKLFSLETSDSYQVLEFVIARLSLGLTVYSMHLGKMWHEKIHD